MVGRNKFFHPSDTMQAVPLGGGIEAWRGFYSSVRPSWKQLVINVNVCTAAFYTPGNLAERLMEFINTCPSMRPAAFVRGVRVRTTHLGYKKTIKTLAKVSSRQHRFTADGLGEVTVEEYFKRSELPVMEYTQLLNIICRVQYYPQVPRSSSGGCWWTDIQLASPRSVYHSREAGISGEGSGRTHLRHARGRVSVSKREWRCHCQSGPYGTWPRAIPTAHQLLRNLRWIRHGRRPRAHPPGSRCVLFGRYRGDH